MSSVFRRKRLVTIKDPNPIIKINLLSLPIETLYNIFLYLSYDNIILLIRTNRYLHNICKDNYFWKIKMNRDFNPGPKEQDFNPGPKIDMTKNIKAQYELALS